MNSIKYKIGAAATTGALLLSSFAPIALADIRVNISGNGSRSENEVSVRHESSTNISQSNHADISNAISVNSNTGGNRTNDNTRGDVEIRSGDSNTHASVANFANLNYLGLSHSGSSGNYNNGSSDYSDNHNDNDKDYDRNDKDRDYKDYGGKEKYRSYGKDDYDRDNKGYGGYSKDHDYDKHSDKDYDSKYAKSYDKSDHDSDKKDYDHKSSDYENKKDYDKDHKDHGYKDNDHDKYGKDGHNEEDKYSETHIESKLDGWQEIPGPGDKDGTGWSKFKIASVNSEICVHMDVDNIKPATAAHIHKGYTGQSGPIVIHLPKPDHEGKVHACMNADKHILKVIEENPSQYYVNVHNDDYPNGAVRGQF